jgi:hypothetical protein
MMLHSMRNLAVVVVAVLLTVTAPSAQTARVAPAAAERPKLVVLLSVDQMRGDYASSPKAHGFGMRTIRTTRR